MEHFMKKIFVCFFCFSFLILCSKSKDEKVKLGKDVNFSDIVFGINFCTTNMIDVIHQLKNKKTDFTLYDYDSKELKITDFNKNQRDIFYIISNNFIGTGINKDKIIKVMYSHDPEDESFALSEIAIDFKLDYYDEFLSKLKSEYGSESMYFNLNGYNENSWISDSEKTCVYYITISKRLKNAPIENENDDICHIDIVTRARNSHVE